MSTNRFYAPILPFLRQRSRRSGQKDGSVLFHCQRMIQKSSSSISSGSIGTKSSVVRLLSNLGNRMGNMTHWSEPTFLARRSKTDLSETP